MPSWRFLSREQADRADIFAEQRTTQRIILRDGKVTSLSSGTESGTSLRLERGEKLQFTFVDGLDEASLSRLDFNRPFKAEQINNDILEKDVIHSEDSQAETRRLVRVLGELCRGVTAADFRASNLEVDYFSFQQRVWIADESGRMVTDDRAAYRISARVRINHPTTSVTASRRWGGSPVHTPLTMDQAYELGRRTVEAALISIEARPAPTGPQTVILEAGAGGVLFHEACGHLLEADFVRQGHSPFAGQVGKRVASPLVNGVDDPTAPHLAGSFNFDDEGVPARRKTLIESGILTSFLSDRREAFLGGAGLTPGNGRRRTYRHPPLPRMSNTLFLAGSAPPEEILHETKNGVYATSLSRGKVDPQSGRFRFTIAAGYRIENGRLTHPLPGMLVSGIGPQALMAIDRMGTNAQIDPTAAGCIKEGQTIPVSLGHPTVRITPLWIWPPEPLAEVQEAR